MIASTISTEFSSQVSKMVKLKVLFLLLALQESVSANNETTEQTIKLPQKQVSTQNSSVNITKLPKIQQNLSITLNNDAKNRSNKLTEFQDSIELSKRKRHPKTRRNIARTLMWKFPPVNCKHIKCPPEDQPVCAKLLYRNTKTNETMRQFHVIMINICEIKYAACHRGLEATVVPMENCHPKFNKKAVIIATDGKRRERREAGVEKAGEKLNDEGAPTKNILTTAIVGAAISAMPSDHEPKIELTVEIETDDDKTNVNPTDPLDDDSKNAALNEVDNEDTNNEYIGDAHDSRYNSPDYTLDPKSAHIIAISDSDSENENIPVIEGSAEDEHGSFDDHDADSAFESEESMDGSYTQYAEESTLVNDKVGQAQNNENCPKDCPARDVMVCASCRHGIYRTFLSVCHLRMYKCFNKDESLQLVTRYPCVMSAPYITEIPQMQPKGHVTEPDDDDPVLRFIRCREKGNLDKKPKCNFNENTKLNEEANVKTIDEKEATEY